MASLGYMHISSEYKEEAHLPAGEYAVQVIKSEVVPTKKEDGEILKLQLQVIEDQHTGRIVFLQFNISNPNPVAADIGRKELGRITSALGLEAIQDSEELHGKPFMAKFGVDIGDGKYPAKNFLQGAKPYAATAQKEPQPRPLAPTASQRPSHAAGGASAGVATAEHMTPGLKDAIHAATNGAAQAAGRTQRKTPFAKDAPF